MRKVVNPFLLPEQEEKQASSGAFVPQGKSPSATALTPEDILNDLIAGRAKKPAAPKPWVTIALAVLLALLTLLILWIGIGVCMNRGILPRADWGYSWLQRILQGA